MQYCLDPERLEGINIGVVLFYRNQAYVKTLNQKSFKFETNDFFDYEVKSFTNRLKMEYFYIADDVERFASKEAGRVILRSPIFIGLVGSPTEMLDILFDQLVKRNTKEITNDS